MFRWAQKLLTKLKQNAVRSIDYGWHIFNLLIKEKIKKEYSYVSNIFLNFLEQLFVKFRLSSKDICRKLQDTSDGFVSRNNKTDQISGDIVI